jgi:hypothetical protein
MIEIIFTLDYEIYGNGTGPLRALVYEPTEQLRAIFEKWNMRFVNFVEVSEFEQIEAAGTDAAISLVKKQVQEMHRSGYEIALHMHPQWYNARHEYGQWLLDYSEYNMCILPQPRVAFMVDRAVDYLRNMVGQPRFTPLSFRAGNWLFQPTRVAAGELSRKGIRIDSSVFKGGLQHDHNLDYRPALKNDYYWSFSSDVNMPDTNGSWLEIPIYTELVAPWKMTTSKRLGMANSYASSRADFRKRVNRGLDLLRFRYPLKFDFCRMTLNEMTSMIERITEKDRQDPDALKPIVVIGHSKDITDFESVDLFLQFLLEKKIRVSTFSEVLERIPSACVASQPHG